VIFEENSLKKDMLMKFWMELHESEPKWRLDTSRIRIWTLEVSKSEAKHAKREPKGPKSEPKEIQKGAEWTQKGVPGAPVGHFWVPLGDEMSSWGQPGTAWAAKLVFP